MTDFNFVDSDIIENNIKKWTKVGLLGYEFDEKRRKETAFALDFAFNYLRYDKGNNENIELMLFPVIYRIIIRLDKDYDYFKLVEEIISIINNFKVFVSSFNSTKYYSELQDIYNMDIELLMVDKFSEIYKSNV